MKPGSHLCPHLIAAALATLAVHPCFAEDGRIVIQREVPPRIAYREAPPGTATTVNASPRDIVVQNLSGPADNGAREVGSEAIASVTGATGTVRPLQPAVEGPHADPGVNAALAAGRGSAGGSSIGRQISGAIKNGLGVLGR